MDQLFRRIDLQLSIATLILLAISLTTLFSVSGIYFRNQLIFVGISILVFIFFTYVDFSFLQSIAKQIYLFSLIAFLFLLFIGLEARGATRWLSFFGLQLQFSEVLKPFLAVSLASFLSTQKKNLTTAGILFLLLFPIVFLIYKQPDLGSAMMYFLSVLLTLFLFGYPLQWFIGLGAGFIALVPLVFHFLHSYQQERILTFLHFTNDPLGSSYNAIQAIIAVGSGMFFGKGLGQGTQSGLRFLPEQHTDFIFATLSEALGFVGACLVIVAFGYLLYRIYSITKNAETIGEKVFLIATFSLLFLQFFVNVGMNIGLLPIVGVPLPLVSYGGSSLVSNAIFLGIASGIGAAQKRKSTLEIA